MDADSAEALEKFFKQGGRIVKVDEAASATEGDILDFLARQGISALRTRNSWKPFLCDGKRISRDALLELANRLRVEQNLKPFTLRRLIKTSRRPTSPTG